MQIEILPKDFIISPTFETGGELQSDFVIKAIRLVNDSNTSIELISLTFELLAGSSIIKSIYYEEDALSAKLANGCDKILKSGFWGLKSMLGSTIQWNCEKITGSTELLPGKETAIVNEFFIVVNKPVVDDIRLRICYAQDGNKCEQQASVPVVDYKTKNDYIFPVKGIWQVNGNYDCIGAHRTQYSMEFAIDLGQLNQEGMCVWKDEMKDDDFLAYGKDILAIADGEVIDCFHDAYWRINFPHDTASDEEKEERAKIQKEVGRLPIQCGNYVVLKHSNGEYSFYGHMIKNSSTVQKGALVKQGDIIGKIGNVGFSGSPHLHFQLMDGPDFYSARGLPCHFTNIIDTFRNNLSLIQEEYTVVCAL